MDASAELKARMLVARAGQRTERIEIPDVGTITVRGMSRAEFQSIGERYPQQGAEQERYILSMCVVEPTLTMDEVAQWQAASEPHEINEVALAVNRLSGLAKGADKEAYKSPGE